VADPDLRQLQAWFWRSIAAKPGAGEFEPRLVAAIAPSRTLDCAQRLQVYADAYVSRLRAALAEDFPRTAQLLDESEFDRLVRDYLGAHPSTEPSLRHLGRAMAGFIRERDGLPDWLADLAALEWARVNAFDAPADEPLTAAQLSAIDPAQWPKLHMSAVRSLEVINAQWPVHRLWLAEDSPAGVQPCATAIRVWRRPDFQVVHAPMDRFESAAISSLLKGSSFAAICQAFDQPDEQEAAHQAGALLLRWLEDGIIANPAAQPK
jgi:hypothetical protein